MCPGQILSLSRIIASLFLTPQVKKCEDLMSSLLCLLSDDKLDMRGPLHTNKSLIHDTLNLENILLGVQEVKIRI